MFRKKDVDWPEEEYEAAVLKSICTGEETFGFIRKCDGKFTGLSLVSRENTLDKLKKKYRVTGEVKEIY